MAPTPSTPLRTPPISPHATYTPSGLWVPTLPASPPIHPQWPNTPKSPQCPHIPPIPLLAPKYLHSLLAPNTPLTPLMAPTPLKVPNVPICHWYPFWPWVPTLLASPQCTPSLPDTPYTPSFQLSSLCNWPFSTQLKCSFSIIIIFNCCHFATDHSHAVKMLVLCLFVEMTKFKSYLSSYHPMQKASNWKSGLVCYWLQFSIDHL